MENSRLQEIFAGISAAFNPDQLLQTLFVFIIFIAVLSLILWLVYLSYKVNMKKITVPLNKEVVSKMPLEHKETLNVIQKRVVYEIISEFRRKEFLAETVSDTLLEKYSEYFYQNVKRLSINEKKARELLNFFYPLFPGSIIELHIFHDGRLYIFESTVTELKEQKIVINDINNVLVPLKKGTKFYIHYQSHNLFFTGECSLLEIIPDKSLVLNGPFHIVWSNQRRYSRIPLENLAGSLSTENAHGKTEVSLGDISFEGVQIETSENLKRRTVYQLSFQEYFTGINFEFEKLECVISKAFFSRNGTYKYGMTWLAMERKDKEQLSDYLKLKAENLKKKTISGN
jgi:hypothetical protein